MLTPMPSLPPQMLSREIDGILCVSAFDAARLLGVGELYVNRLVAKHLLPWLGTPKQRFIPVEAIWLLVPPDLQHGQPD